MLRIINLVGARPQFIKSAGISREMGKMKDIEEVYVHSGQHYDADMSEHFFEELQLPKPAYHMNAGKFKGEEQVEYLTTKLSSLFDELEPDAVIVYGDTNTTLSGALAAGHAGVPLAHVEAGLRSYNQTMPEEYNRVKTDRLARWLFCPTPTSVKNLAKEGLLSTSMRKVILCGDVQFDNIKYQGERINIPFIQGLTGGSDYALLTIHRNFNTDNLERLIPLLDNISTVCKELGVKVVFPAHPRLVQVMEDNPSVKKRISDPVFITTAPASYGEIISLMKMARFVLTDSGGITKEAAILGSRVLVLRQETEWTEWVDSGCAFIVDTDLEKMRSALSPDRKQGKMPEMFQKLAAPVIVETIKNDLL